MPRKMILWLKKKVLSAVYSKNPGCTTGSADDCRYWCDQAVKSGERITFSHCGGLGDLLFSLHFCREFAGYYGINGYDFHIYTVDNAPPGLGVAAADFIKPLLENLPEIGKVTIGYDLPADANEVALGNYWKQKINFGATDIRSWYYNLTTVHLPREFWKPVILADADYRHQDKILFSYTGRYCNVHIDCGQLKQFREHLVFIGTAGEYETFCRSFFDLEYQPCENMLEMAQYMAGAKGFIGGQSGIYSLAECMKIPRILLAPEFVKSDGVIIPGPHNNHPIGGWCEDAASTEKMVFAVKSLLAKE